MKGQCFKAVAKRREFLFYSLIGASGALLDFLVYCALIRWLGWHHQAANLAGITCGITNNFWLNARFNFKTGDRLGWRFLSFYGVGCFGLALSALMLYFGVDRLNLDKTLAKLATIFAIVIVQYNLNRMVSFRKAAEHGR